MVWIDLTNGSSLVKALYFIFELRSIFLFFSMGVIWNSCMLSNADFFLFFSMGVIWNSCMLSKADFFLLGSLTGETC